MVSGKHVSTLFHLLSTKGVAISAGAKVGLELGLSSAKTPGDAWNNHVAMTTVHVVMH